jgi:hypothetical protein
MKSLFLMLHLFGSSSSSSGSPLMTIAIDSLVKFEKTETGEDKISYLGDKEFKTMRLFVAASRDTAYDDPRSTILDDLPLPENKPYERGELKPAIFTPINYNDTMASVCYRKVHRRPGSEEDFVACEVEQEEDESSKLTGGEAVDPEELEAMGATPFKMVPLWKCALRRQMILDGVGFPLCAQ